MTNTINEKKCSMVANETTIHPSRNILKVTNYRSKYGLQHGGIYSHRTFKGPKITSVKQLKQNTKRSSLYKKRETVMNHTNIQQPLNFQQQGSGLGTGA